MTFLERFKGKLSHLDKHGIINNLELSSSPIEKSKLQVSKSQIYTSSSNSF